MMKHYREYIIAILLAGMLTLIWSCDNTRDKEELSEDISQAYENALNNHQSYVKAQDSLEASMAEWEKEHDVFTDDYQPSDSLEEEHQMLKEDYQELVNQHEQFIDEHEQFVARIESMKSEVSEQAEKIKGEISDIYASIEQYLSEHKQMMLEYEEMEKKHDDFLYGQRVDLH